MSNKIYLFIRFLRLHHRCWLLPLSLNGSIRATNLYHVTVLQHFCHKLHVPVCGRPPGQVNPSVISGICTETLLIKGIHVYQLDWCVINVLDSPLQMQLWNCTEAFLIKPALWCTAGGDEGGIFMKTFNLPFDNCLTWANRLILHTSA